MATCTTMTDDWPMNDVTTGEMLVDHLDLSELEAASWGVSWAPGSRVARAWLDGEDDHPPDEAHQSLCEAWDAWSPFEQLDPYVEDVRRIRRLFVGS